MENLNNGINIFSSDKFGRVRTIINADGTISINAEDAARGLGWVQVKNEKLYVKWERVNDFISTLGFSPLVGKDDYIPESLFYLLGMKANNETAQQFQKWIAVDVLPEIRKNGAYKNMSFDSRIKKQELSPELKAIFCIDKRTVEIGDRLEKLENNMTIDYSQQEELRMLVVKKIVSVLGGKDSPAYRELNKKAFSSIWREFKRVMDVNSYRNTPILRFHFARQMIIDWHPDRELELMIKGANSNLT
ncbi:ORF6C domain-containing protein [uncultured Clostridium sp.]|uniref:ORF6C domain-containing protein n=1 Tax=uncultured Clostridium sp. TaxID=59620 RepID=UPI0025F93FBB|nr:ORF6C domain-containing protein [uncultured Clostridium sp.]